MSIAILWKAQAFQATTISKKAHGILEELDIIHNKGGKEFWHDFVWLLFLTKRQNLAFQQACVSFSPCSPHWLLPHQEALALTVDGDLYYPDIRAGDVIRRNALVWSRLLFGDGCQFQVLSFCHKLLYACKRKRERTSTTPGFSMKHRAWWCEGKHSAPSRRLAPNLTLLSS